MDESVSEHVTVGQFHEHFERTRRIEAMLVSMGGVNVLCAGYDEAIPCPECRGERWIVRYRVSDGIVFECEHCKHEVVGLAGIMALEAVEHGRA